MLPFFVLAKDILQAHLNGLIFFSLLAATLLLPNMWLKLMGLLITAWLGYAYLLKFLGPFPSGPFIDASLIIFFGSLLYLFVFHSNLSPAFYFGAMCISALIQASIAICQRMWFDPVSETLAYLVTVTGVLDFSTPVGTLGNTNFLGAYLAISLPFFFRRKWAWFLPIIAYGLYITNARAACGAAIVGTGFFFLGWKGFFGAIIPGLAYITAVGGHSWGQLLHSDRYLFWIDAIKRVCDSVPSFLVGYGQGTTWMINNELHSEYAATFFRYGIIGLFCMGGYIVTTFRDVRAYRSPSRRLLRAGGNTPLTAFLILCVNMVANHPLHIVPTAILAVVVMALLEREKAITVEAGPAPALL